MERLQITLDDKHAEKLALMADRMHVQPEDRVVVVGIQDARSSTAATVTRG